MKKNRIVILMLVMIVIFTNIAVADEGMPDDAYGAINPDYRPSNSTHLILPDELCDCPSIIPPEPHEVDDMEDPFALEIYNIASKEIIIIPSNDTTQQPDRSNPDSIQPYQGLLPPGIVPESIIGPDGRVQVFDTTTYPWRTICKLYSTFPDGAVGGCSGAIIGCPDGHGYHVLTAGHCIHSQDNGGWATSVRVIPGLDNTDMPLNYAWATYLRSYTGWTENEDHRHDWALITLDRNIGDYAGWMGRMTASSSSSIYTGILNTAGYPGDKGSVTMWFDSDSGCSANDNNHWYKMDTWEGQSGSPVWRYIDNSRYILTVHAYGNGGSGCNHGTRLNNDKFDRIITWCNSDTSPTDKADLIDDGQTYSGFSPTLVSPGLTNFHSWCDVRNVGTASSGGFNVSYYASTNTIISTGDFLIGTDYVYSIYPFNWKDSNWTGTFPSGVPDGEYYVGWIIDSGSDVTEFVESNNVEYKDSYKLNVDGTEPSAPVISSSTHPNENTWYCTQNPTFTWTSPSDPFGIYGYSYTLDHSSSTTPNTVRDTTGNSKSYTNLAYGIWYFHVRARDNAGNWGPADHYKIMIENCNEKDGCYIYGTGCEDRNYYCSGSTCTYTYSNRHTDYYDDFVNYCKGNEIWKHRHLHNFYCDGDTCTDHTTWVDDQIVENCDKSDGWNDTGVTEWIDDPYNTCSEKEQKEHEYRDYSCSKAACTYIVTGTQWKDTGNTRNKPDGTVCGCSDHNTIMKCSQGECYDTNICDSTYCNADANCDGKEPGSSCGSGICDDTCQCTSSGMMCGDVDNNDILNIMDVNLLMKHVIDPINYPVDQWAGNVDGIGGIDNLDVILLVMHVFDPNANPLACGSQ